MSECYLEYMQKALTYLQKLEFLGGTPLKARKLTSGEHPFDRECILSNTDMYLTLPVKIFLTLTLNI